ncbi:MAG TPA: hypothetical protein VMT26_01195 [Candidatus Bathyarchaeia archaeon]|jgi:Ca2+-binding EF-hand superfamily protein|nr:hypothetical protein [Candidatus Bathyarchaeia archaeon]
MDKQATDRILDALKNGRYHTPKEITEKAAMEERKVRLIIAFLEKFQFIDIDKNGNIKLSNLTKQFLQKLNETDPTSSYEEITA